MKNYNFSQARQQFATILEEARKEGAVRIQRRDGQSFILRPEVSKESPLDVEGVDVGLATGELVSIVRESRRPRGATRLTSIALGRRQSRRP
jgi:PHD/YefM family antitoxin component YafN of YafNO toxin-antitoxin module